VVEAPVLLDQNDDVIESGDVLGRVKCRHHLLLLFIVSSQVGLLPLQPPLPKPRKMSFVPAVSVRVTCDPEVKLALHVGPQLMPAGYC